MRYFHTDHLGSVTAITDETGLVVERLAYDAWGKRRFTNGTADVNDTVVGLTSDRGYTEHEMLDELGIIHMNGRVYDPYIGRFMSADPYIQAPYELQSHNRYAYVMNNPLLYTDPSGFNWFRKLFVAVVIIVATVYTMGAVAGAMGFGSGMAGIAAATTGATATLGSAMLVGAAGGFVSGFLGGVLNGASFSDSLKAGAVGAITGAAFSAVGNTFAANSFGNYLGHAVVGCVSSVSGGGQCGSGAASAVIGKWATNNTGDWGTVGSGVAAAVAGGVSSAATGGSFVNGARTAAYGYLFNQVATGILDGGFANRPLINWGAIGSSLTGLAARINVFVAAMSLAGDTPKNQGVFYHYTTEAGFQGINAAGYIRQSNDGNVYLTKNLYLTPNDAQNHNATEYKPVGYFVVPESNAKPYVRPTPIDPANGFEGGGFEYKAPHKVYINGSVFIRF